MGPRFCKRGNCLFADFDDPDALLQWGHAFVSVETAERLLRPFSPDQLQWGHAFVSVETTPPVNGARRFSALQWGHAFVSVETQNYDCRYSDWYLASMGPRFCKRGNIVGTNVGLLGSVGLQWGHAFVSVETSSGMAIIT